MADQPTTAAATLTLMQVCAWESSQHALHSVGTAALFLLSLSTFLLFSFHFVDWTRRRQVVAVVGRKLLGRSCAYTVEM